eukprot:scaffold10345_cov158-Cylindrotheca_fusiformis.AAC.8
MPNLILEWYLAGGGKRAKFQRSTTKEEVEEPFTLFSRAMAPWCHDGASFQKDNDIEVNNCKSATESTGSNGMVFMT